MVDSLALRGTHVLLDFPGFGTTPRPVETWGTEDYASSANILIRSLKNSRRVIWVGHSFGARVGLQLAANHSTCVDALFLIAAAGLPRKRNHLSKIQMQVRIRTFKTLKAMAQVAHLPTDGLARFFGSRDYAGAGRMRDILSRVVREDLSAVAPNIQCPTVLVYGTNDTETPVDIGERLATLIPNSTLHILPGQDHYSVLDSGRHHTLKKLVPLLEEMSCNPRTRS